MRKDIAGNRYGKLTAIRPTERRTSARAIIWECLCDCGETSFYSTSALNSGTIKSCGCSQYNAIDITGKRFGRLVVLKRSEIKKDSRPHWECQCDCGNIVTVLGDKLKRGTKASCGCHYRSKQFIDLTGQRIGRLTVLGLSENNLGHAIAFECLCDCGNTTTVRMDCLKRGTTKSCGCLGAEVNAQALEKARQLMCVENTNVYQLGGKIRANNTSGTTGVYYNNRLKMWVATIGFKKKTYYLGRFSEKEDAIMVRKEAEQRLHLTFIEWYRENVRKE